VWLLRDDELLAFLEDNDNYLDYGRPMLTQIESKYGSKDSKTIRLYINGPRMEWGNGNPKEKD
jgi:hypothetical protein